MRPAAPPVPPPATDIAVPLLASLDIGRIGG